MSGMYSRPGGARRSQASAPEAPRPGSEGRPPARPHGPTSRIGHLAGPALQEQPPRLAGVEGRVAPPQDDGERVVGGAVREDAWPGRPGKRRQRSRKAPAVARPAQSTVSSKAMGTKASVELARLAADVEGPVEDRSRTGGPARRREPAPARPQRHHRQAGAAQAHGLVQSVHGIGRVDVVDPEARAPGCGAPPSRSSSSSREASPPGTP